jgi:hypothetical protein
MKHHLDISAVWFSASHYDDPKQKASLPGGCFILKRTTKCSLSLNDLYRLWAGLDYYDLPQVKKESL